jgi:hypothetical protein
VLLPIARAPGQNDTHRAVLAEPVGAVDGEQLREPRAGTIDPALDRSYRALADRNRADEKQSLRWPDGSFASAKRNSSDSIRSAAAEAISGYRRYGRQRLRLRGVACCIPSGTGCGGW